MPQFINNIYSMQNIEIKRNSKKRSIESLIEESALDNSFNYEAHQLRKAFNETLLTMNAKNTEREREIEKLKIILKEYEENKGKSDARISKLQEELSQRNNQYQELNESYREIKKKLQYLQFKFENITENRNLFDRQDSYQEEDEATSKRRLKTQIYNEFNKIIVKKIDYFTSDLKRLSMSTDVEAKIESFLEELLYLNPYSEFHILDKIKQEQREVHHGKIRREYGENITSQDEWKKLEKSLQKLKEANKKRMPLQDQQSNRIRESKRQRERSVSTNKRRKLFDH